VTRASAGARTIDGKTRPVELAPPTADSLGRGGSWNEGREGNGRDGTKGSGLNSRGSRSALLTPPAMVAAVVVGEPVAALGRATAGAAAGSATTTGPSRRRLVVVVGLPPPPNEGKNRIGNAYGRGGLGLPLRACSASRTVDDDSRAYTHQAPLPYVSTPPFEQQGHGVKSSSERTPTTAGSISFVRGIIRVSTGLYASLYRSVRPRALLLSSAEADALRSRQKWARRQNLFAQVSPPA
jgi:hypothetical protein